MLIYNALQNNAIFRVFRPKVFLFSKTRRTRGHLSGFLVRHKPQVGESRTGLSEQARAGAGICSITRTDVGEMLLLATAHGAVPRAADARAQCRQMAF